MLYCLYHGVLNEIIEKSILQYIFVSQIQQEHVIYSIEKSITTFLHPA